MTVVYEFKAEETSESRPYTFQAVTLPTVDVTFIDGPMNPVETIARVVKGYEGNYDPAYAMSNEDVEKALTDLNRTKLKTPLEMGTVVFLLNGVPRSWTHQAVRTRIGASYVQESMRFTGHQPLYRVLISKRLAESRIFPTYCGGLLRSIFEYERALSAGIPGEEARAIIPTDILTSMFVGYQLSTFAKVFEQRMCCQAQKGIWQDIMKSMRDHLERVYGPSMSNLIKAPFERGEDCGYRASFDRPCTWKKHEKI